METARGLARAAEDRLEAEAHDHHRVVGRRRVGAARIDRVGREAPGGAGDEGRRVHQQRQHRQGLAGDGRLALAAGVRQRGRARRAGSARHGQERARGQARRAIEQAKTDDGEAPSCDARRHRRSTRSARARTTPRSSITCTIASLNLGFGGDGQAAASITRSTTRSTGTRTSPTATSRTPRRCRASIGTALLRLADADDPAVRVQAARQHCVDYVDEIEKLAVADAATETDTSTSTPLRAAIAKLRSQRPTYEAALWRVVPGSTKWPRERRQLAELNRTLYRPSGRSATSRAAAPRLVQAPRLRAGLLHRLRRQDAARHPRRDRAEAMGRGAAVRADRRRRRDRA